MHQLSNQTIADRRSRPIRIMQFGGGNFIRAFVDWMIDQLNEKTDFNGNVAVIKPTERGDYDTLRQQDGLFYVILNGIRDGQMVTEQKLIKCIQQIIHPYQDWSEYLKLAENPDLRYIVSNTTESGIRFNPDDAFDSEPPPEFPAKLTVWLYHRYLYYHGDLDKTCIFLPLELVAQNGDLLKECILSYAKLWRLGEDFKHWINAQTFCNTLVDRIVSGFPRDDAERLQKELGVRDDLMVAGEYYHNWIIQVPGFVQAELPFAKTGLNVQFTEDLDIHRKIKVRLLNGAHTSLVPIGYLCGFRTVGTAINNQSIRSFIEKELLLEIIPTIDYPEKELKTFAKDVLDRFSNPTLQHQLLDISLNSTTKFVTRLLPSLLDYQKKYQRLPARITFAFAALIRFYQGEWQGESIPLRDSADRIQFFAETWSLHQDSLSTLVDQILAKEEIWGMNLSEIEGMRDTLVHWLTVINDQFELSDIDF